MLQEDQGKPLSGPTFPRVHTHYLTHLPKGEFKSVEVREGEFARFLLSVEGKVVAEGNVPGVVWGHYHKLMEKALANPSEGDVVLAHSFGVRLTSEVVEVRETQEVQAAREDYLNRFFSTYTLSGK